MGTDHQDTTVYLSGMSEHGVGGDIRLRIYLQ